MFSIFLILFDIIINNKKSNIRQISVPRGEIKTIRLSRIYNNVTKLRRD